MSPTEMSEKEFLASLNADPGKYHHFTTPELEKFVTLIVEECATIADNESSQPFENYSQLIRNHFGL